MPAVTFPIASVQAFELVRQGWRTDEVATWFRVTPQTIRHWVRQYDPSAPARRPKPTTGKSPMTAKTVILQAATTAEGPILREALLARAIVDLPDDYAAIRREVERLVAAGELLEEALPGGRITYRLANQPEPEVARRGPYTEHGLAGQVHRLLKAGPMSSALLAERLGRNKKSIGSALGKLRNRGVVMPPDFQGGRWQLVDGVTA